MKRMLALVFVLGFGAAAAFAQSTPAPTLVWNGYLGTGFLASSFGGGTPGLSIYDAADQTGSRLNLQAKYDAGSYGFFIRLREDDTWAQGNSGLLRVRRVFGWMDALNGMVRLQAGRLGDFAWATGSGAGWNAFGNLDGPVGLQVQVKPVPGLNVGAFVPFTQGANAAATVTADVGGAQNQTVKLPSSVSGLGAPYASAVDAFDNMLIGGAYYLKGAGDVELGYQLAPSSFTSTGSSANGVYPFFYFGAAYTAMPALTAYLESRIATTATPSSNFMYFDEKLGYNLAPLNFTLWAEQLVYGDSTKGTNLHFQPIVDYTMGVADFGLFGNVETKSSTGGFGYSAGPFVQLNLGKNVYTKISAEFGGGDVAPPAPGAPLADYPGAYGSAYQWAANAGTFWQAYVNLVYNF